MALKANSAAMQIFVMICGILFSLFSGWFLYNIEEKAIVSEFQKDIDERAASLSREIEINIEALYTLATLFSQESTPDFHAFTTQARKTLNRHNDIQALEWVPRVPHAQRQAFENELRKSFADFEFTERKSQGYMTVAQQRAEYFPVYYVEPLVGNETAFGFDLASNVTRRETLEKSRDSAKAQATASIMLVQEHSKEKAFLAFLPIYKGQPSTLAKRKQNLQGFILGVYRIADIFASSTLNDELLGLAIEVVDDTEPSKVDLLYSHSSSTGFTIKKDISYTKALPEILGRKWSLIGSPTQSYISVRRSILPLFVLSAGIIFTFFITVYIRSITKQAFLVQSIVIEKTNELNKANKRLKKLSRIDGLTGIANRRFMDEFLDREWLRAIRQESSVSFLLIDIDFFKAYNDNYGHLAGDECLKKVGACLKEQVNRAVDMVARYGGEEFAFVLLDTHNVELIAQRCLKSIEALNIKHEFSPVGPVVSISIGYCTLIPQKGSDPSSLIAAADEALYKAKERGRNNALASLTAISAQTFSI
ncbi:CHASE domain-containing protein [Colwellia psychrerythraea]|uniref:diguanylate cyclase n=1 Tax=Colwellia psychrerythraea TaxID=28229 RepID=A0A099L3A5_COLPS|nr:CHASE domain-containing protein [Colwellia psychrerythraea]KGJ97341.1 diguanylate cyclase with Chase sensor [Colwellia psychrerythraea]